MYLYLCFLTLSIVSVKSVILLYMVRMRDCYKVKDSIQVIVCCVHSVKTVLPVIFAFCGVQKVMSYNICGISKYSVLSLTSVLVLVSVSAESVSTPSLFIFP